MSSLQMPKVDNSIMSKKDKKLIRYTDREFSSIKESLVNYTKRYYPEVLIELHEALRNLGFRIYGPSNFGRTFSDTKCFSRTGMLLLFIKAKKAYLSIHN